VARADVAAFLAEAPPLLEPAASPGPDASASPALYDETVKGTAFLSAVRPAPDGRERILDQGGSYLTSVGQMVGYVTSVIGDFHPYKGGAREPSPHIVGIIHRVRLLPRQGNGPRSSRQQQCRWR
jgi:hypothetical protein